MGSLAWNWRTRTMKRLHPDLARVLKALGITEFNDVQKAAA